MSRHIGWLAAIALACTTLLAAGCQTTPAEVEEAPLGEAGQKKLRNTLLGTWRKTEGLPPVARGAVDGRSNDEQTNDQSIVLWAFNQDGSGAKTTRSTPKVDGTERSFKWHLEGRNIVIDYDDSPKSIYFRAETWSPAQMQWFHYVSGERRTVKRYGK